MSITIKTPEEIERCASRRPAGCRGPAIRSAYMYGKGRHRELDRICHDYIVDVQQAIPARSTIAGFPNPSARRSTMWSATAFRTEEAEEGDVSISISP